MKLYKHKDYNEYKDAQIKKNISKINVKWVKVKELTFISTHIKNNIPNINFGICHGVRNGFEVDQFRKFLNINIIGTEISATAKRFKNVINWDFHDVKDEWLRKTDFIYSNSFDHSYDPKLCLDRWMSCIKKDGICYIHQTITEKRCNTVDSADCFAATEQEYEKLINEKYFLFDKFSCIKDRIIFCIKNKKEII